MFKGEKTAIYWIGLVVFGYSIYEFCNAGWYIFAYSQYYAMVSFEIYPAFLETIIPSIIGGIIFLVIGLYIMKAGARKSNPQTQEQT